MKTTTILKTLALALLMPTMLLTTACSNSDDIVNTENPANTKGYALPVTVNVTRQGGDATRATYDESTRKLSFSAGDKLLVVGNYDGYQHHFAGLLTWQSGSTFSGTIMTETEYSGTAVERLSSGNDYCYAVLMPAGYTDYGYLSIENEGAYNAYQLTHFSKLFAPTKKEAVEQLSHEYAEYSNGFALAPGNAIVSFTISGLAANKEVAVCFKETDGEDAIPGNVTTNAEGVATFAVGMDNGDNFDEYSLTVDGTAIALPEDINVEAGHIYNISRAVAPAPTYPLLSAATTEDIGKVVCAAGHLHDAKTAVPSGCTAVGIVGKVTATGHGLILALKDAASQEWNTIDGWTSETTYAGTTLKVLPDDAARGNLTSYTALGETTVSNWAVGQKNDYVAIFTNLGSTKSGNYGTTYDDNVNAYITTGVGGDAIDGYYWSATSTSKTSLSAWCFKNEKVDYDNKNGSFFVRPVLGF